MMESFGFIKIVIISLLMKRSGVCIIIFSIIMIMFCICIILFVSFVMRVFGLNLLIFLNENDIIFLKRLYFKL